MRLAISSIALLACTSLASAADLGGPYQYEGSIKDGPIATQYNWSGLYVGGHAGWATGGWDGRMSYTDHDPTWAMPLFAFDSSRKSYDDDNWLGGLQIGFNRQHGSLVWGLEADISWTDLSDSQRHRPYPNNANTPAWDIGLKLDRFGTVRGRLGLVATPRLLLYGTGGFAWAKTSADQAVVYLEPTPQAQSYEGGVATRGSADENHFGWAAGLGGEYMLTGKLTVRAEWLHVDLGKEDYNFVGVNTQTKAISTTDGFPSDLTFDVFRVGVNYRFGH